MPIVQSYFKLTTRINCLTGGIAETYNLNPPTASLGAAIPIALGLIQYRGQILAKGAAIVDACISVENFTNNYPDGFRFPATSLFKGILMKKINDVTSETVIEDYADPSQGIHWKLDTGAGIVDGRMIRMIRGSWAAGNAFAGLNVLPGPSNVPPFTISTGVVTLAVGVGKYMDAVRDNCCSIQKAPTGFLLTPYGRSATVNWSITGISKKKVGYAWPRVQGRQAAFA